MKRRYDDEPILHGGPRAGERVPESVLHRKWPEGTDPKITMPADRLDYSGDKNPDPHVVIKTATYRRVLLTDGEDGYWYRWEWSPHE